ncbi:MAG TPA: pantoate--beta-alanine ligase, partial [Gemmatales bacterium]|nr:pantoate--beta-alanine ligase [Gemmatales bacterium]
MAIALVETVKELRSRLAQARGEGRSIAFVPTMGALHAGHAKLVEQAAAGPGKPLVVVSIFVNPTQFRPEEDFQRYPRTLEADRALCEASGAHLIFAPTVETMYGRGSFSAGQSASSTFVEVPGLSEVLEGASRPGHFRGVATVVAKLFLLVQPDFAYFGQKDAQQLAVLRRMVRELHFPITLVGCPTVREPDGLAMSSRNRYLSPEQRAHSTVLYRALGRAAELVQAGERDCRKLEQAMTNMLDS